MRRGTIAIIGLLLASTAMPSSAEARPLLFKMMGALSSPLRAVLGGGRSMGHRSAYRHHRAWASHRRPAAVAAAPAAAAAAATAATANPDTTPSTTGSAPSGSAPSGSALSNAAPAQRNAALASPGDESQAGAPESATDRAANHFGTVGPAAWPSAYADVIGYTLWPKDYGDRLRTHGIGDVLSTALAPIAAIEARTKQARADEPNRRAVVPGAVVCGGVDVTDADWPIAEIKSTTELDAAQNTALDQFRTSLSDAIGAIKATCHDDTNASPVERLRTMQNTLWAVHDAAQLIREPLARFYDSLNDDQKGKFSAPDSPQPTGRPSRIQMARMCDLPGSTEALRQIEQTIRPTTPQRASLEALQKKASDMGQFLLASCLKPMPATPAERLDAAADRLTALIFAASNVNMALNDFTSQLSDEQKTKLNAMVR
jgi:hypothetical protein